MPIYEYECHNCSKGFELLVRNQGEIISCPHCGSTDVEKLISRTHSRAADHWKHDMRRGLAMSKEFDDMRVEQKKHL